MKYITGINIVQIFVSNVVCIWISLLQSSPIYYNKLPEQT